MQTDIYYRDITKTESMEAYLLDKIESSIEDFFKYDSGAHLTVRVEKDRHRSPTRKPSYMCEVVLKPNRSRTQAIVVRKTHESFKKCVHVTAETLKRILAKRSSKKSQHGRRDPMLDYVPELWPEEQAVV